MQIIPILDAEQIKRDYGLMKILAGGKKLKTKNIDMRILEIEPKSSTSKHYHIKSESVFYILRGLVELETSTKIMRAKKSDIILVEPNEFHMIRNIANRKCVILEVMSPPFSKSDIFYE